MNKIDPKLLSALYGKDLIAYGTGRVGKVVIPYLAQQEGIRLHGVTSSKINEMDAGLFPGTNLPVRSIQAWAEIMPDAVILISVINPGGQKEIQQICKNCGFHKLLFVPLDLVNAIAYSNLDIYAVPQEESVTGKPWIRPEGNPWLSLMCLANQVHEVHKKSFSEFHGRHRGEVVAVVGTGPSLCYYSPGERMKHIGVNAAFKHPGLELDYYFLTHYIPEWCNELKEYDFVKFFSYFEVFPEYIIEENQARRYFISQPSRDIHADIEYYPLMGCESIIFPAIQFALYTRPRQLLLVGCDCTANGHFDADECSYYMDPAVAAWKDGYRRLKVFCNQHYPDTEIISVNPVGLKGMFHDVYTQSYLDAHPELDQIGCEILDISELENVE